jgi:trigger factor
VKSKDKLFNPSPDSMKVTLEKLPASQVSFEIEVEGEKSQAIYDRTVQKLTKNAEIPGFRKGKAPKQLILRQFGATQLKAGVLEELLEESLSQALKEQGEEIKPIGQFQMRSPLEEIVANFEIGKPLTFQAAIDVEPEVPSVNYQGLTVQAEKIEPKLERVDKLLGDFQLRRSTLVPVENRPAQVNDEVTVSYTMFDAETNEEILEETSEDESLDLEDGLEEGDFEFGIIGMNSGETKDIPVTFADDNEDDDLAGKSVLYKVTLKEIKENELPALDDEFAQAISEKQTMAELREFLEQREIDAATKATKANVTAALLSALAQDLEVEVPDTLIVEEVNFLIREQINYLSSQPQMKGLIGQIFTKENMPQIAETAKPEATLRVKRSLAIIKVAELEKIEPTEEEIEQKIQEVLEDMTDAKKVDLNRLRDIIVSDLTSEKVIEWLEQNNQVEFVPEGSLELAELDRDLENISEDAQENPSTAEILIEAETVTESDPESSESESLENSSASEASISQTEVLLETEAISEAAIAPEVQVSEDKAPGEKTKSKKAKI